MRERRLARSIGQHEELAPAMAQHAASVIGPGLRPGIVELVEPGIGVGLQDPGVAGQMPARMLAAAVARVEEDRRRRRRAAERPVVAHIGPEPAGDGLASWPAPAPWCRRRGCARRRAHARRISVDQRRQRRRAGADPVGQRRDVEIDALAGDSVSLCRFSGWCLPNLRVQDHRQQARPGPAAGDRMERRRRLGDRLAGPAGELLAHGLDHLPLARDHLQRLGDVLAELGELAAAARAGGRRRDHDPLARQMRRQRRAHRLAAGEADAPSSRPGCGRARRRPRPRWRAASSSSSCSSSWSSSLRPRSDDGAEPVALQLGDQQLQMRHHRLGAGGAGLGLAAAPRARRAAPPSARRCRREACRARRHEHD